MKTISGYILVNILGWKIIGDFPDIKKSIVICAPHTSYFDAFYGKLYLNEKGIKYNILSKKELFYFPMNLVMKIIGSIPVTRDKKFISQVVEIFQNKDELHIILCPEGHLRKITRWKKGYYYMAKEAGIPIVVSFIDYRKKEIGIKKIIVELDDYDIVRNQVADLYSDVSGKYPENFSTEIINKQNFKYDKNIN